MWVKLQRPCVLKTAFLPFSQFWLLAALCLTIRCLWWNCNVVHRTNVNHIHLPCAICFSVSYFINFARYGYYYDSDCENLALNKYTFCLLFIIKFNVVFSTVNFSNLNKHENNAKACGEMVCRCEHSARCKLEMEFFMFLMCGTLFLCPVSFGFGNLTELLETFEAFFPLFLLHPKISIANRCGWMLSLIHSSLS